MDTPGLINSGAHFVNRRDSSGRVYCLDAATVATAPEVLKGVIIAQAGPFNEHPPRGQFNDDSLRSIVHALRENDKLGGTKCEFDHNSVIGSYVGKIRTPRLSSTTRPDGKTVACV